MKSIFKYSLLLFMAIAMAGVFVSCDDDDDASGGGEPSISYVRITDPASSDSLLVSAGQGQMVVFVGQNLGGVRQLWVNDQRAQLNPSFITDNMIITRVPSDIPLEISNKVKLIFGGGKELLYDFAVDISAPSIDRMKSEFVNTGDVATIYGNYFYEPITVTFTGGVEGEIITREDLLLEVKVPEGAQPGPITITTNFGSTESGFWFRDNRNIIASFDGTTSGLWHGPAYIITSDADISAIQGKFIRMKKNMNAWDWFELYVGPVESDVAKELKNIPADAFENPGDYSLKFEINTLKSLSGANIHMYIGPTIEPGRHSAKYIWKPNINTNGEWETVSIPWTDVLAANSQLVYNPAGYGTSIHFSGPSAFEGNFGLDNMRVVLNGN
jgi:hypothetical protein